MSGKRKPVLMHFKDTSSSGSDEDSSQQQQHNPRLSSDKDDFGSAASPGGSSTASGPICVRTPGFSHHAHEFTLKKTTNGNNHNIQTSSGFKGKKKKALEEKSLSSSVKLCDTEHAVKTSSKSEPSICTQNPGKCRTKREPLPMKLRALPQSFWQQPNATIDISPGQIYAKLPPLLNKDTSDEIRSPCSSSSTEFKNNKTQAQGKSFIRVSDPDWIFQIFDVLDHNNSKTPLSKRGRPKKVPPVHNARVLKMEDPVLGITATDTIVPILSSAEKSVTCQPATLTMISLKDRDKSISLPALHIEKNYSQMLSEVVVQL